MQTSCQLKEAYESVGMKFWGEPFPDLAKKALEREVRGQEQRHGDPIVASLNSKREYDTVQDAKVYWRLKSRGFAFMGPVDQNAKRDGLFEM